MSRASEIAAAYAKLHESRFAPKKWAYVQNDGNLRVEEFIFAPADALALAAWIIETFGDNPSKVSDGNGPEPDISSKVETVTITRALFDEAISGVWGRKIDANVAFNMRVVLGFPLEKG